MTVQVQFWPGFVDRFLGNLAHDLNVMGLDVELTLVGDTNHVMRIQAKNRETGRSTAIEVHGDKPVPEEELLAYAAKLIDRHTKIGPRR